MQRTVIGALGAALDQGVSRLLGAGFAGPRFYADGWGNLEQLAKVEAMLAENGADDLPGIDSVEFGADWAAAWGWSLPLAALGVRIREGAFDAPLAAYLPEESKRARFLLVEPTRGAIRGVVCVMAAQGDQGYTARLSMTAVPLARAGYVSLILVAPYYGKRRPRGQIAHFQRTVADFLLAASGCITEANALSEWAAARWPGVPRGVCGFSFGGAMTCVTATLLHGRIAFVPYCGSPSPEVMLSGVLRSQIDFGALERDGGLTAEQAEARLQDLLAQRTLRLFIQRAQDATVTGPRPLVSCVYATDDEFVQPDAARELHMEMQKLDPDAKLTAIPGGHVSAFVLMWLLHTPEVLATMDRLREEGARVDDSARDGAP